MRNLDLEIKEEDIQKFSDLINSAGNIRRGVIMSAMVTSIDDSYVFVDVGLKSEGRVAKEEFLFSENGDLPAIGSSIHVFLEALEDKSVDVSLSYIKAQRESGWETLEEIFRKRESIMGKAVRKVQGGCIVNVNSVSAFLPKSHFPLNCKEPKDLIGKQLSFSIIKMDRAKSNIVVSCKSAMEEGDSLGLTENQTVKGVIRSVNENGAFIDIGEKTGRLNASEISWNEDVDPSKVLKVGEEIEVKVIGMTPPNKISLSLRQLTEDPWLKSVKEKGVEPGKKFKVRVERIESKNLIVIAEGSIEGRIRAQDMAWMKRYQNFNTISQGQNLEVEVLELEEKRRKVIFGLKQAQSNPVEVFNSNHKAGDCVDCEVVGTSDLGYVVKINEGLDGIIPKIDMYVSGSLKTGEKIKAYVWDINVENGHIVMGVKQPSA